MQTFQIATAVRVLNLTFAVEVRCLVHKSHNYNVILIKKKHFKLLQPCQGMNLFTIVIKNDFIHHTHKNKNDFTHQKTKKQKTMSSNDFDLLKTCQLKTRALSRNFTA